MIFGKSITTNPTMWILTFSLVAELSSTYHNRSIGLTMMDAPQVYLPRCQFTLITPRGDASATSIINAFVAIPIILTAYLSRVTKAGYPAGIVLFSTKKAGLHGHHRLFSETYRSIVSPNNLSSISMHRQGGGRIKWLSV